MTLYSKIEGLGNPNKIVIIHGFLGMSDNWKSIAIQLVKDNYEVHSVDLRNHGRSFHSDLFNYQLMAEDIKNYCLENNLKSIDIIGHSMGGKTAMLFGCLHPHLIRKLIIADIGPKYYPPHHQSILKGIASVDFNTITDRNEVDVILAESIAEIGTRQFLLKNLYRITPNEFAFRFNRDVLIKNIHEIGKELPQDLHYTGETLFVRGALSAYVLDDDLGDIQKQFPKAQFKTITNAGHWLHAENPTDFYTTVISFLQ